MNKNKIILFWSTFNVKTDKDYNSWINKKINISAFHLLTLRSHIKLKNNTTLYSYQEFNEGQVPEGIKVKDANDIFDSKKAFDSLINGHSIAHISDVVRLRVAADVSGIVLDMDAVMLKELPEDDSWFASMPAKLTGGLAPKWGDAHPPLCINDNSWDGKALFNFPVKVNKIIKADIMKLCDEIIATLKVEPKTGSKAWNYVIWGVKKLIGINKESKVFEPIYFHPLPAWLRKGNCYSLEYPSRLDGKTELFGTPLPDITDIFIKSFVVHHFFESSAHSQGGYGVTTNESENNEILFWKKLHKSSLLGLEAYFIIGKDWRKTLMDRAIQINK
jgi:hypothetical protein